MKDNDHTHDTGFPWWPGLVDYCPEKEETLLLDPETNQPQQYHVVFFDKVSPPPPETAVHFRISYSGTECVA